MRQLLEGLVKGFRSAFDSKTKVLSTVSIGTASFILISLSTSIGYSKQMFLAGYQYWYPAIETTTLLIISESGIYGLGINLIYSLLIAVTLTNFYSILKNNGLRLRNLSGIAPGFIAAGCAGCGLGVLGFLGLAGGVALLPFQGELIRIIGLTALIYFIVRTGDPTTCEV